MANANSSCLPRLTDEQRRAAAGQFERANQVITAGDPDYGIQLLLTCCRLDPGSPVYRQTLRQTEKAKFGNRRSGRLRAFLGTWRLRARMNKAMRAGAYLKVLDYGEQILARDPWDLPAHLAMAKAFEELGIQAMAVWTLDQVRQVEPNNPRVNRPLARLFEERGNYAAAMALWELVRKAEPDDIEAQHKFKDLAASATIAKGRYHDAIQGNAPSPLATGAEQGGAESAADQPADGTNGAIPALEPRVPREVLNLEAKIAADPTNANAYLHLASYYRRADKLDQAQKVLLDGLGPTGNSFELSQELADLETEAFRQDLAVAEEKLRSRPKDEELLAIRARLVKEVATRELDYFRQRSDRFPTDNSYKFEVGVRLMKTGQVDEAISQLQAIRSDPRHQGKALVYLGFCFKSRNNWRLAQRNFEEALPRLGVGDEALRKEILFQLAKGHAEAGDVHRAVDFGCELANLDFAYNDIGKLLDEWNAQLQKA